MLPKVEACLDFVKGGDDRCAIITLLEKASDAVKGLTGTKIVKQEDDLNNISHRTSFLAKNRSFYCSYFMGNIPYSS